MTIYEVLKAIHIGTNKVQVWDGTGEYFDSAEKATDWAQKNLDVWVIVEREVK